MAYTFLKAQGYEIGKSLVDDSKIDYCKEMMLRHRKRALSCCCPLTLPALLTSPIPSTHLSKLRSFPLPQSRLTWKAAISAPRA